MTFYNGSEGGPNIPPPGNAPFFDFDRQTIETILSRSDQSGTPPAGIRFHFDADLPNIPSRILAIGVSRGLDTTEIFDPSQLHYSASDGTQLNRQQFEGLMLLPNGSKRNRACVYFSEMVIKQMLAPKMGMTPFGIRLFIVPFFFNGQSHQTLSAISLDSTKMMDGNFSRSELPCPPSCGTDYK